MLQMAVENIQYALVDTLKGMPSGVEPIRVLKKRKTIKFIGYYLGCPHSGRQMQF